MIFEKTWFIAAVWFFNGFLLRRACFLDLQRKYERLERENIYLKYQLESLESIE